MHLLNERVLKTVEKSGLDYFHFTEHEQSGNGFGNRFSNAIQRVFKKGYQQVICIGNDTPQLQGAHIRTAVDSLNQGIAINGPSLDGGFYLMGIHASQFDAKCFESLPWQTGKLASSYLQLLHNGNVQVGSLEHLIDLDSLGDVEQLLQGKDQRGLLVQLILSTLVHTRTIQSYRVREISSISFEIPLNKGSPVSIAA